MGRPRYKPRPICQTCKQEFTPKSNLALSKAKYCSGKCYGIWRAKNEKIKAHLQVIAPLGRAGWTEESNKSYLINMSGDKNPAWKGGVTFKRNKGNYIGPKYVRCPTEYLEMSRKDGYVMEHRLVMAQHLGRCLSRVEVVHHIDHNTRNNDISNLQLFANNKDHKIAEGLEAKRKKVA